MIKVTLRRNVEPEVYLIPENTTIRQFLEDNGVEYARRAIHLDGKPVENLLDEQFTSFGEKESFHLSVITKADNA